MIKEVSYGGWNRNLQLSSATTELVITLDVGPRIIRYGFPGGDNVFVEFPEQLGKHDEHEWRIRGGHRFWTAPEADHSYDPDNGPVAWKHFGEEGVEIIQLPSRRYGFQKTLFIEPLPDEVVRVTHRLRNVGVAPLELSPWALSTMRAGGTALIPQPLLDVHPNEFPKGRVAKEEDFLPNRELVLWPFTNITDGRFAYSSHFLRVVNEPGRPSSKIGMRLPTGWVAYQNGDDVFAKHFASDPKESYPDRNSSFELFTDSALLELESLAPNRPLEPGEHHDHIEHWVLRKAPDLHREDAAVAFFEALPVVA